MFSERELNEARNHAHNSVVTFMDDLIGRVKEATSAAAVRPHGVLAPDSRNSILLALETTETPYFLFPVQPTHQQAQMTAHQGPQISRISKNQYCLRYRPTARLT